MSDMVVPGRAVMETRPTPLPKQDTEIQAFDATHTVLRQLRTSRHRCTAGLKGFHDTIRGLGSENSVKRAQGGAYVAQSAIWTVNLQTFETSAQWVNADGSAESLSLLTQNGDLFMTSNPGAFPEAQSLTAAASFPDPTAACALITNYDVVVVLIWVALRARICANADLDKKIRELPVIARQVIKFFKAACDFKNVLLSSTLPSSRKRQDTGARVDLGYGYISVDYRETGERYLTNDATELGGLSLSGTRIWYTNSGVDHRYALMNSGMRLNLGSSAVTAPGSLPQDTDNSMAPGRAIGNDGKSFVAETAVWTVDAMTGNIDAYWIDGTGRRNRVMPVTNGDNLFFAPEAIYDQISATPLAIRAELPNTTAPPPPGGAADCRTGTVKCPACSDAINQCRAPDGTCVARDEVGACGYNCFPGNEFAGPSPDCYFGMSQSGCTALPCPDPVNEFRNRTGCFTIPTCVPPQVCIGNGQCGRVMSGGEWSSA
ncbi:hypothetical protein CERZMDRAFT_94005 [Cercospora zeae-maydis SCOH1-5]|uniref:Uncharacterized protein n=1 Tax=Cercospora zeae-maydis SCOH1-5 TaxID=717836 RepID=A0A6A6FQ64_9PEZI|nr:hypothetical protein CERZMDRAFT_94005 [Cercospora zeae-maydis SCOH1-5]